MMWIFLAVLVPSLVSLFGTEIVRRYAIRTSMVDIPNDRSSHTVPTPRGGGIAMVFGITGTLVLLTVLLPEQRSAAIGILGGGLMVAGIGMLDDRYDLSARVRLITQFAAAVWVLFWLGGVGHVELLGFNLSIAMLPVAALFIVWSTNVFNFMDGLDGFAGGQAVIASTAAAFLCLASSDSLLAFLMLSTSGAAAGFLVWNWPPARIFMGDCGSGFLGFLFASTAIAAHKNGSISITAGITLLLVFLIDATLTLLRRMYQGEQWYKPHKSHAYQLATQLGASHRQVTLISIVLFTAAASLAIVAASPTAFSTIAVVAYAASIVGVWLAINWLFIGRTQALSSINMEGRVTPKPDGMSDIAAAMYLRFTQLQTKYQSWRSVVPQDELLAEATGVASRLGYNVSHDWLDGCGGGSCEAAGEKWILLDFNMAKSDQIRQILLTIHDEANGLDMLSNDMRAALIKAKTESWQPTSKAA